MQKKKYMEFLCCFLLAITLRLITLAGKRLYNLTIFPLLIIFGGIALPSRANFCQEAHVLVHDSPHFFSFL